MSATLQTTHNDSVVMDISNAVPSAPTMEEKRPVNTTRPSILRMPYSEDQKENIIVNDDTDIELSLIMQPPTKPAPSKPLFSTSSLISSSRASLFKPSLFNFARKSEASETTTAGERTSGSDNMDISGIEPTIPFEEPEMKPAYKYEDFLRQNNLIANAKSGTNNRRQTINQSVDMQLDKIESLPAVQPMTLPQKSNPERTFNEPHEISIDCETKFNVRAQQPTANDQKPRRETIVAAQDMQLDSSQMDESPIVQRKELPPKSILHRNVRTTTPEPFEMSLEPIDANCAQLSDMSIEFLPSELQSRQIRRQTTHKAHDISLDTSTFGMNPRQMTENLPLDMSLDTMHWKNSPINQPNDSKKSTQLSKRMTIVEPREMSFDSTTKSATQTYSNKTIFGDISMDLQYTEAIPKQPPRKSVICKSPSKNSTKLFDQSDAFEMTNGAELNSMYMSYHPIQSTRINDGNCSKFTDIDSNASIQDENVKNNTFHPSSDIDGTFVGEKKNENSIPVKQVQIFNQTKRQTIHETRDLDMSEDSPIPTAKKYNLNKTPFYYGIDKENNPDLFETLHASDLSSLDLTNNSKEEKQLSAFKADSADARRGTELFHATIHNDSNLDEANETDTFPIEISDSSIIVEPEKPTIADSKRRTCFKEMSMIMEPIPKTEQKRVSNIWTQSILQITPIKIDDSIERRSPNSVEKNMCLTVVNGSPFDYKNTMNGLEESKQLTFIEDDDEDDQICNTKLDLALSLESSDIDDFVERKCASITNKSCNLSKFSLHSEIIDMPSIHSEKAFSMKGIDETLPVEPMPQFPDTLKVNELQAFKKSSRLRHSNVFELNTTAEANQSESIVTDKAFDENISIGHMKNVSMAPISQSSIMQRRSNSIGTNNDANETSYLSKSTADKPLSEIKIDFSGYDKLVGLATPQDVFKDFCNRMDQIKIKAKQCEDERNKFENGEIESIDPFNSNNNDDDLVSQNVEVPSWTFLYKNKMKWEE